MKKPLLGLFKALLFVLIIDAIVLGIWIHTIDVSPSNSMMLLIYIPEVFGINLLIAGIALVIGYAATSKAIMMASKVFLVNALMAPVLFIVFHNFASEKYQNDGYRVYHFIVDGYRYNISLQLAEGHLKENCDYSVEKILSPTSSEEPLYGQYMISKDTIILLHDSTNLKIFNETLTGFPSVNEPINLK